MYDYPPLWFRARAVTLTCISFASFSWTVYLSFYIFYEWDVIHTAEQSVVVLLLLVNAITLVVLLVLLILPFRAWLDAARCMFLLISHIGVAVAIIHWRPQFQCIVADIAKDAFCNFTATFMLPTSWVIPSLVVVYVIGLSFVVYRVRKHGPQNGDLEKSGSSRANSTFTRGPSMFGPMLESRWDTLPLPSPTVSVTSKTSARLSKPIRVSYGYY